SLRPRWFVAGGTGLAPILSMLRRMAEYQEMIDARLFFGVNRQRACRGWFPCELSGLGWRDALGADGAFGSLQRQASVMWRVVNVRPSFVANQTLRDASPLARLFGRV
ncbi:hypothetical protein ACEPT7_17365, partial [Burkholderia ubonensis]